MRWGKCSRTRKVVAVSGAVLGVIILLGIVGCIDEEAANSIAPTATPVPAPSCPTAEEQAYLDAIQADLRRLGVLTEMMAEDLGRASTDPLLYVDELWGMTMENHFYTLQRSADDLLEHGAPASAVAIDELIHRMVGDYKTAMGLFEQGLSNLDPVPLEESDEHMTLAMDDAGYIGGQIASFCQIQGR